MNIDPLTLTLLFILLVTLAAAVIRALCRDKCLLSFHRDLVTLERKGLEPVEGVLRVVPTGLELVYVDKKDHENGLLESSLLFYKNEYPVMQSLLRFHDRLGEKGQKARERRLKQVYHPGFFRKTARKTANFLKSVRDSILEVVNVLISAAKTRGPAGAVMSSQEKYIHQVKTEIAGSVATSFEPLMERYIGHRVLFEMSAGDQILRLSGILKDYTAAFIELMDVDYPLGGCGARRADVIVPRSGATVRHWAE